MVVQRIFPRDSLQLSKTDYYGFRHVHLVFSAQSFLGKLSEEEIIMPTDMRILLLFLTSAFRVENLFRFCDIRLLKGGALSPCLWSHHLSSKEDVIHWTHLFHCWSICSALLMLDKGFDTLNFFPQCVFRMNSYMWDADDFRWLL